MRLDWRAGRVRVRGDRGAMAQAIGNVLSNAVEHGTGMVEVPYRGQEGALFKRDYGGLFLELFPELELRGQGFLGKDQGWDDVTWWVLEKT